MILSNDDIKRLNDIKYSSFRLLTKGNHCLFICYFLFFVRMVRSFYFYFIRSKENVKKVLFVAHSLNTQRTLNPIREHLFSVESSQWNNFNRDINQLKVFFISLLHIRQFQQFYNQSKEEDKPLIRKFYFDFMTTVGVYKVLDDLLAQSSHLEVIVMANDHFLVQRCLIELAPKYNIKTIYTQHASVTRRFPPLHFNYSFLDGWDSYEKYKSVGNLWGTIFLSGSPRFDSLFMFKRNISYVKSNKIGIALNLIDSLKIAFFLCKFLSSHKYQIVLRPHQNLEGKADFSNFISLGCEMSYPSKESSFEYISKIGVLIANESSIHLDAALMGVPTILYNFTDHQVLDWYDYLKKGLITECKSEKDVLDKLQGEIKPKTELIKSHYAALETCHEGRIGLLIATFIIDLLTNKDVTKWLEYIFENGGEEHCYVYRNEQKSI